MPSVPTVRQGSSKPKDGWKLRVFGRDITITKAPVGATDISPLVADRGWFNIIREPFTGAWQRNREIRSESVIAYNAVYACVTLIASDISKMCIRLVQQDGYGIWSETTSPAFTPVLRKPNRYQNRIKFIEQWVVSKLLHGNAYILKQRDLRGVVVAMYVLDPCRVKPLVAPDGSVYYQLSKDNLSGVDVSSVTVPASEIIHDTMVPLYHPLCGVSPLYACGVAAMHGLSIQANATNFFQNSSIPSGILTAPATIDEVTATRLKTDWEANYSGQNYGRVAVLGDGLKYERLGMTAAESQMIEQLKWTAETVCSCFHVPPYMVGVGTAPKYDNIEAMNQQYYSQCLQALIESIELCLDEGLGLPDVPGQTYGTEFDLDGLLRMDTATQYRTIGEGVKGGFLAPNEGRSKIGLEPVKGGDTPYLQQQNFSLAALDRRDQSDDPFALSPNKDQNTPTQAQQDQAAAAVDDPAASAAKSQLARWEFQKAMDALPPLAA
ncbi:phage portal protein [Bradyrhizobium elkanii]|uniref:phage portal protein n=1 Tax=Bradyrhizobium elkanii TaxID=29448 RepID=UPI0027154C8C|nr:phage portal protein [Bradyrhizobium elkanii]WLB69093.1 phage portal protein [Bradyrhizobium elkanii]